MSDNYITPNKQDLDKVVVPENTEFYEEMDLILHLAKKYPDNIRLELNFPTSKSKIDEFENKNNIKLTDELRALYMFADGFSVSSGHLDILELDKVEKSLDTKWEWGDTKHYILLGDMIGDGEEIFLNLDNGKIISYEHGAEEEYHSIAMLLSDIIFTFIDGEVEDEKLNEYIGDWEDV
ncbi:MAG: SMI1/KNR4 family protein [Ruminococcus sp.]|nr:SMI1/KNR4 family protein [Ruminococcus sp.]